MLKKEFVYIFRRMKNKRGKYDDKKNITHCKQKISFYFIKHVIFHSFNKKKHKQKNEEKINDYYIMIIIPKTNIY